jgi:hypothetical protein
MPKPPGSGLQIRPRAPHPLHLTACLRGRPLVSGILEHVTVKRTTVKYSLFISYGQKNGCGRGY